MKTQRKIITRLPAELSEELTTVPQDIWDITEEIRLRNGQPVCLRYGMRERHLNLRTNSQLLQQTLNQLIQFSYYAYEDDLARGFVTVEGGHRVGICGKMVIKHGQPAVMREISSMNIRFARSIKGCCRKILPEIMNNGKPMNTLIVSPPGCGKTTLLRDLARELSENRFHVAVCDERSELAGMYDGQPSFDLGPRCDVLDGCEKNWGIPLLIRSMAPQVLVTDEVGKPEDVSSIMQCLTSGVTLLTSIHGTCYDDLLKSSIGSLIEKGVFRRFVYLTAQNGAGTVREVTSFD